MTIVDPRSTQLKNMKGNDLKVLVAMWLLGAVNIGNKAIKEFLGLHYTTIQNCLDNLAGLGMVTKTHRTQGWQITDGGRQMLLPSDPSHIFYDSEAISSSNINNLKIKDINITTTKEMSAKNCDQEIQKELHNMGIFDPKAFDLACMEHVTLEYIASWETALRFKQVGTGGRDIPLVIYKMGHKHPAPTIPKEYLESDICHICGDSAWDHGGLRRCNGRHYYTLGKRDTCYQCSEIECICCIDCSEYPCTCGESDE